MVIIGSMKPNDTTQINNFIMVRAFLSVTTDVLHSGIINPGPLF